MLVRPLPSCSHVLFLLQPSSSFHTPSSKCMPAVSTQLTLGTLLQVCEAAVGGERRLLHRQPAARGPEPGGRPAEAGARGPQAHPHRPRLPALLRWALTAFSGAADLHSQPFAITGWQKQAVSTACPASQKRPPNLHAAELLARQLSAGGQGNGNTAGGTQYTQINTPAGILSTASQWE